MTTIIQGKKETYADINLPSDLCCIECGELVRRKDSVLSGGYHFGIPDIFLCANCARESDLHIFGYVIGDAIISNYHMNWGALQYKVKDVMKNLERSVLRAIVSQLQFRLK